MAGIVNIDTKINTTGKKSTALWLKWILFFSESDTDATGPPASYRTCVSNQNKIKYSVKLVHISARKLMVWTENSACAFRYFWAYFHIFLTTFGCSFEQRTRTVYLNIWNRNSKVLKEFFKSSVFSKPAVATVNKILLLVKYKVNSSGLQVAFLSQASLIKLNMSVPKYKWPPRDWVHRKHVEFHIWQILFLNVPSNDNQRNAITQWSGRTCCRLW